MNGVTFCCKLGMVVVQLIAEHVGKNRDCGMVGMIWDIQEWPGSFLQDPYMVWDVHYTFKNGLGHCFEDPYMVWGKNVV